MKQLCNILLFSIVITAGCFGQGAGSGPGYQTLLMANPALSGAEGDAVLRLSYVNIYPGNNYNLHSFYTSFDAYTESLHGGAGVWISNEYLGGIVNDLRGGLSYAYFLKAGKELFINAGLSASFYHRGFNFEKAVLPDQIDPLGGISLPSSESLSDRGRTVFDMGTGFLFIYRNFFGGFSVNHLSKPDISIDGISEERLAPGLLVHLSGRIPAGGSGTLKINPLGYFEIQGKFRTMGAGTAIEGKALALNLVLIGDNAGNLNVQTGFTIKAGRVGVFYNYRLNIVSRNDMMPLSLLHQTGLSFSLNNVDKRITGKTITFPKM